MRLMLAAGMVCALCACGGKDETSVGVTQTFQVDFRQSADGWTAGFADYPVGEENFYELSSGHGSLPAPLASRKGYKLSGNNHSDDLFMYMKKKISGLEPNTLYDLTFFLTFATQAPSGCAGVGGAPGESVFVKAGAVSREPEAEVDAEDMYRMNIEIGNQAIAGSDSALLGNVASTQECGEDEYDFELKSLNATHDPFSAYTNSRGELWVFFGTDSGFEGPSTFYMVEGKVVAQARD
jgi:hypothetical protein